MTGLVRALDVVAVVCTVLALAVLAVGTVGVAPLTLSRAEDLVVVVALVVAARVVFAPIRLPPVPSRVLLVGGVTLYLVLMGTIVVTRHLAFRTHALDLGYYVQLVWNLAHAHGARVTLPAMHAWGDHFSPVLYLFIPLGWLVPGAVSLVLAQTAILAAGALGVYAFTHRRLGDARVAAGMAGLYLLNPTLHGINVRDVHPAAFAVPLVVTAALAFDSRRPVWCAAALMLALASREDAAVAGVGFAVWLALARRRWALGAGLALVCVAVLWADINALMPHFRGEAYPHLKRFAYLGDSLPEVLTTIVFEPWRWLGVVLTTPKLVYVVALVAPLGFLPLLAPRAAAGALPGLAMTLLSTDPALFNYRSQYQAFVLPFLVLAAVEGFAVFRSRVWWAARLPPAAPLTAGVLVSLVLTSNTVNDLGVGKWALSPHQRALYRLLASVPPTESASVNERVVPHLAARHEIYVYPAGMDRSEWILDREEALAREAPRGFDVLAREHGWILMRRSLPH